MELSDLEKLEDFEKLWKGEFISLEKLWKAELIGLEKLRKLWKVELISLEKLWRVEGFFGWVNLVWGIGECMVEITVKYFLHLAVSVLAIVGKEGFLLLTVGHVISPVGGEKENGDTGDEADTLVRVERMEELVLDRAFDRERAAEQAAQTEA
ncbi:hypothetical protein WH47_04917 [Habropoda laboriosa]|uniref:Uncharacterized protein n=1 Tax=Habropoda laboriosa TaxID=597456 RepID=A0A0L7RJM7_9HYME|nr:hypothetical protein WH47_04917 [Habropoda laboriosa]